MDKMNNFFGHTFVKKMKFISFDDDKLALATNMNKKTNVTIRKYEKKINSINNEKIKKSLMELTKVFKQK